jgi:hypothetical protein
VVPLAGGPPSVIFTAVLRQTSVRKDNLLKLVLIHGSHRSGTTLMIISFPSKMTMKSGLSVWLKDTRWWKGIATDVASMTSSCAG